MNTIFLDEADLQNIRQNKKPETEVSSCYEKHYAIEDTIDLLKRDYYGLASFANQKEEETFLKQMSLKSDVGIILEWKGFLKSYLFWLERSWHPA